MKPRQEPPHSPRPSLTDILKQATTPIKTIGAAELEAAPMRLASPTDLEEKAVAAYRMPMPAARLVELLQWMGDLHSESLIVEIQGEWIAIKKP